ncbi:hypothetical protein CYMTET_19366 [Cymbomonas tetramitiformis]|uniref:Ion transport domain-containing protein n=1 Tax=Cymbomonas tetramitiformis TaxID=36881 RepID=A0AAE0G658_9CHLO|nr:hypothetical protein CYMTET_19366 [Cymbomonas tetramitiformis]
MELSSVKHEKKTSFISQMFGQSEDTNDRRSLARSESWKLFIHDAFIPKLEIEEDLYESHTKNGEAIKELYPAGWPWLVMNPASPYRRAWDFLILLFVVFSSFLLPFDICFYATSRECDEGEQGILHCSKPQALTVLELIVDLLFWWDLVLNFRTAYIPKHARDRGYITTPKRLALNYLKGWFLVDLMGSIPFDTIVRIFENWKVTQQSADFSFLKAFKLPRMFRTGRLMKQVDQVSAANFFRIFQLLFFVCLLSHWVASAWFFAAAWQYKGKDSDVDIYEADEWDCNSWSGCPWVMEEGIANATLTTQYWTSMYWAQLMLTSVSPPVHAYTNLERGFVCTVALLGAVVSAFLFGNVAVLMQRFDLQSSRMQDHMAQINLFLRFHDVPKELSTRVRNNIEGLWKLSSGWDTGALLSGLPDCLVKDVQMEVHRVRPIPPASAEHRR